MFVRGWKEGEVESANGYRISLWNNENILKLDNVDHYTTL